jgi:putative acetyltransferase
MVKTIAGGLDDPQVVHLLGVHLSNSRAQTAPGSAHALDLSGLKAPEISFWSARDEEKLLAVGVMKRLSAAHAEVKSMHRPRPLAVAASTRRCRSTSSTRRATAALRD